MGLEGLEEGLKEEAEEEKVKGFAVALSFVFFVGPEEFDAKGAARGVPEEGLLKTNSGALEFNFVFFLLEDVDLPSDDMMTTVSDVTQWNP